MMNFSEYHAFYQEKPHFTLKDILATIPNHCLKPRLAKSIFWFLFDAAIIAGLLLWATTIESWYLWPVYWFCQGSALWSLFMIGHDCGHRSFAKQVWINNLFGHLSHTPLLVPFHGWRISHRKHHRNTGHFKNDESHVPITKTTYQKVRRSIVFRSLMTIYYLGLYFPIYLLINRRRDFKMNHFLPSSLLFTREEKWDVITSTLWFMAMLGGLGIACYKFGFKPVLCLYIIPWAIFIVWLDTVTYLQHSDKRLPWYNDESWNFVRGSFSTIDRDYGRIFNFFHHRIGSHHVIHHLCASIPHYHLVEATDSIRELAGPWLRHCDRSIVRSYLESATSCKFIEDEGEVRFFKPDAEALEPALVAKPISN